MKESENPLITLTDDEEENLFNIACALDEYTKTLGRGRIVHIYFFDDKRYRLGVVTPEPNGLDVFNPFTVETLETALWSVARWRYDTRGGDGKTYGHKGIPKKWLRTALNAPPQKIIFWKGHTDEDLERCKTEPQTLCATCGKASVCKLPIQGIENSVCGEYQNEDLDQ